LRDLSTSLEITDCLAIFWVKLPGLLKMIFEMRPSVPTSQPALGVAKATTQNPITLDLGRAVVITAKNGS
jgi:hypothetical protein